ncbi:MAG: hypothetical protein K9H16_09795 [Bacteroidales bacterium]|nr:hypothetical protein [Bacteroidales bacterium]
MKKFTVLIILQFTAVAIMAQSWSLKFYGSYNHVTINSSPDFSVTDELTIEAWIKVDAFDKDWQAMITRGDDSWRLHRNAGTNQVAFSTTGLSNQDLSGTIEVNDGKWHHIAAVYDGSKKYLYIDGRLDVSVEVTGALATNNKVVLIGGNSDYMDRGFKGYIDEVRIYNAARTAAEIRAMLCGFLYTTEPGLIAYYQMSDGSGSALTDNSGNGHPGAISWASWENDYQVPEGDGSEANPYKMSGIQNLQWLRSRIDIWSQFKHFRQENDIDASSTACWDFGQGFLPIGDIYSILRPFKGYYDGQGYCIDSLTINRPSGNRLALFGYLEESTLENLCLTNAFISGDTEVSILGARVINNCFITNCTTSGVISGNGIQTGGLISSTENSTIRSCSSSVDIEINNPRKAYIGGLVGAVNTNVVIENCYATGNVIADDCWHVGGLIGDIDHTPVTVSNCYSSGVVTGQMGGNLTGGLIGTIAYPSGGVQIQNSFWDTEASGIAISAGGTGKTTVEMKTESTFTNAGWDFSAIWGINGFDNEGYPFLLPIGMPIVTTDEISNIETNSAQSGGNVLDEGFSSVFSKGIIWDDSGIPMVTNYLGITNEGGGAGAFTSNLSGLNDTTVYYVRAYATNSEGTGYGSVKTFATLMDEPPAMAPPGNALDFDGTDDYVSILNNESNFDFTTAMTIEAWIKVDNFDEDWQAIVTKGDGAWRLHRHSGTNHISFGTSGLSNVDLEGTTDLNNGQWHHVACVFDGSTKYIYVDGTLDISVSASGTIATNNYLVNIAENGENTGRYFNGLIDEVRIWNIARTQTEIQDNKNNVLTGNESGLVAYYKFDQTSGSYLYDHTENGNQGALQNMDNSDWVPSGWLTDNDTWTGAIDNDWAKPGNWEGATGPPVSGKNAVIPVTTNNPRLESSAEIDGLYISDGASLTIGENGSLTVDGLLSNASGSGGLIIESTATGTGSLISSTASVPATVQRYIAGSPAWHLVSSPVSNATAEAFSGHYLQFFTEATAVWTDIVEPTANLTPAKGYSLWSGEETYTFEGNLNAGNQSIATTQIYEDPNETYYGWNLVGNPYPSSINWAQLDDTWGAVYYYTGTTYATWNNGAQTNNGTQYVAPGQGFFISSDGSNFQLTDAHRTHEGTSNYFKNETAISDMLRLQVSNNQGSDEVCIRQQAEATDNFDRPFDAWKIRTGNAETAQLYTLSGSGILSIDTRPECTEIQLGFSCSLNGLFTFSLAEIHDFTSALIEDTKTGKRHNLLNGSYDFNWKTGDSETRFKLHLNAVGIQENQLSESNILIYAANNQIVIKGAENGEMIVLDVMGRIVLRQEISGKGIITIPVNLLTGVYVVMIATAFETKTEKVLIK